MSIYIYMEKTTVQNYNDLLFSEFNDTGNYLVEMINYLFGCYCIKNKKNFNFKICITWYLPNVFFQNDKTKSAYIFLSINCLEKTNEIRHPLRYKSEIHIV